MAMSLNRAQIIGNVTRDPEVKQIPGGQTVASFGVATNFTWTDSSGQRQEKVEFHNVVAWRKLAEIVGQYVKKGSKIYVEGRIQTRDWEGEDGVKRYRTEIVADNVILLDRKGAPVGEGEMAGFSSTMNRQASGLGNSSRKMVSDKAQQVSDPDAMVGKSSGVASVGSKSSETAVVEEEVTIEDLPF